MLHIHIVYIVHMYATLCNIYVHQIHGLREGARTTNTTQDCLLGSVGLPLSSWGSLREPWALPDPNNPTIPTPTLPSWSSLQNNKFESPGGTPQGHPRTPPRAPQGRPWGPQQLPRVPPQGAPNGHPGGHHSRRFRAVCGGRF